MGGSSCCSGGEPEDNRLPQQFDSTTQTLSEQTPSTTAQQETSSITAQQETPTNILANKKQIACEETHISETQQETLRH